MKVLQKVHREKAAKSNRCRARGRSMARQRGLPPFFPGGAFPEEPRGAVFHSYFHGRDPFIEGCNAALQESISNGAPRAPFLRLSFPAAGVPLGRGYIYVLPCRIFMYFFSPPCCILSKRPPFAPRDQSATNKNALPEWIQRQGCR